MAKILLVEDHQLVREGLKMLLQKEGLEVIAEADNGEDALDLLSGTKDIDIVITDINMNRMDGLTLVKKIHTNYPAIKVVILSMMQDYQYVAKSFELGASAYLVKDMNYNELIFAISHVLEGGRYVCGCVMQDIIDKLSTVSKETEGSKQLMQRLDLTEREMEVLDLIAEGYTNMEIAGKLFLSKRTVEGHRQNLIDKTHVKNSAQLVKYAVKQGLI